MIRAGTLAAGLVLCAQAWAQTPLPPAIDPGAIQQRQIEEERRRQELERLRREPEVDPLKKPDAAQPPVKVAPDSVRFMVREIEFSESEILTKDELEAIARDYRGRELTFGDLQELAERVNALYRAKGVVTAQAVVPPQDVSTGVVRIRLVEGRLGAIRLEGNNNTWEGFVKWRLRQEPGELVDIEDLERKLIWFNRTTDAQLRAELKPGEAFGTTDLNLTLVEPPRHDLRFFFDNAGFESTGESRQGVIYVNRSVSRSRDVLSLSAIRADGMNSYSVTYGVPFNRWHGRLTYGYYKDYTEVLYGPVASLDITGEAKAHILTLRQPTYVTQAVKIDITGGYTKRESESWISGVFLQSTDLETGNLGAELLFTNPKGYGLANYYVTAGHASFTGSSRNNYEIGRGTLLGAYDLGNAWSARGNLRFQHTEEDLLPSSEQYYIGGEGSVRGYPVAVRSGRQGYTVNLELHRPLGVLGEGGGAEVATTGFLFADYGYVRPFRPPNSTLRSYDQLSSIGFGLELVPGKLVSARLTFGYALNHLPGEARRYVINFLLVASAF